MITLLDKLQSHVADIPSSESVSKDGKVSQVVGLVIEATGPRGAVGSLCKIQPDNCDLISAEIGNVGKLDVQICG